MNRLVVIGIGVLAALYLLFSSMFIVNEREQAIVMRFGGITNIYSEPGLYFKLPTSMIDTVQIVEKRLLRYDLSDMTVQVSGGKFYQVDAFLTYRISDARRFRTNLQGDLGLAENRIATRFDAALRQVYGRRDFNAALSDQRTAMMNEARDLIRADMGELGIDIVDVRILRTDLTQQVSAQTYDRMKAERLAEAALLRARGKEAAQSLRAIADRQAVEIVAEARRDSEILRGEGEAQRSAVYADAYNADPEFFEFYRSMQSYRTALGAQGTTMVLSPNSEFFRYFGTNDSVNSGAIPSGTPMIPSTNPTQTVRPKAVPAPAAAPAPAEAPAEAQAPATVTP